jgi:hypothetical protein
MYEGRRSVGSVLLTGPELKELLDATSEAFDPTNSTFATGIVLEGEGKPVEIKRVTPYPAIQDFEEEDF